MRFKAPDSFPPVVRDSDVEQLPRRARGQAAFTMIEIALCLAIIGFALVAIIGVLPTGMGVQKDNREETVINQEAATWMDILRSGSQGHDDLTNYLVGITNFVREYTISGASPNLKTNAGRR